MPAAIPNRVSTQVRLDETAWKKLKEIAKRENRNANAQLNYVVIKAVEAYERENGTISVQE